MSWELARTGNWGEAERVARSITGDDDERGQALAVLAECLARAGHAERAESVAISISSDPEDYGSFHEKLIALGEVASVYAVAGRADDARRVAETTIAETEAFSAVADWEVPDVLAEIAGVLGRIGDIGRAVEVLLQATGLASAARDSAPPLHAIALQYERLSRSGDADAVVALIRPPGLRERAVRDLLRMRQEKVGS